MENQLNPGLGWRGWRVIAKTFWGKIYLPYNHTTLMLRIRGELLESGELWTISTSGFIFFFRETGKVVMIWCGVLTIGNPFYRNISA
jgi:hypothetical protein